MKPFLLFKGIDNTINKIIISLNINIILEVKININIYINKFKIEYELRNINIINVETCYKFID